MTWHFGVLFVHKLSLFKMEYSWGPKILKENHENYQENYLCRATLKKGPLTLESKKNSVTHKWFS